MIRSRDVVFNERVMYKDRNTQVSEPEEPGYFGPNDVSENRVLEPAQSAVRRSTRTPIPNRKYLQYMLLTDAGEPECYDEAYQGKDASKWELTMKDEMNSLISNQT
ncbi:hypothetical protein LWI29_012848 [Acer saccharum]|uniref:Uncharacterized protein n=1 Tax=Acer saccharum TaxID=4024 RepID=A0AA39SQ65_ACESA|nr:hypothetical protein LWI29_012848 [Acer saccharum]